MQMPRTYAYIYASNVPSKHLLAFEGSFLKGSIFRRVTRRGSLFQKYATRHVILPPRRRQNNQEAKRKRAAHESCILKIENVKVAEAFVVSVRVRAKLD
eukprot:5460361-Pyramimonas_sp.AAC.1